MSSELPTLSTMTSVAIMGEPLIATPSMATRTVGVVLLVTLSEFDEPLSLALSRSGDPGVPGIRVSMTKVNVPAESTEFKPSLILERNT